MIWATLGFCLVAVVGSIAYAAMRAWRLWKTMRATSKRASDATGRVLASAATAEEHVASLTDGTERLATAMERLQTSLAEFAAIRAAAAETGALLASIRAMVPRK